MRVRGKCQGGAKKTKKNTSLNFLIFFSEGSHYGWIAVT